MDAEELRERLSTVFDDALIHHGFTKYMRDYEMVVFQSVGPGALVRERYVRLVFQNCVDTSVRTRIRPDVWVRSLDDGLIDEHRATPDSTGYVWGVQSQELYPGASVVDPSTRAEYWSELIGIRFFETWRQMRITST